MENNSEPTDFSLPTQEDNSYSFQDITPDQMITPYFPSNDYEIQPFSVYYPVISFDQYNNPIYQLVPYFPYQVPYYDLSGDQSTPYYTQFPMALDYTDKQAIIEAFPHLEGINDPEFDLESVSPNAHFYVLRSSNHDNIHKAIKYHMWTSTESGKSLLKKAWQEFEEAGVTPEIYFIFTVINSNQFLGVAKMASNVDANETFNYWWEPNKWFGSFQINWLFIKDIDYSHFDQITEKGNPLAKAKDGTKLSAESGKEVLKIFMEFSEEQNIFDYFEFMDRREDVIRFQRDNNYEPQYQESFDPYSQGQQVSSPEKNQYSNKQTRRKYTPRENKKYSSPSTNNVNNQSSPRTPYRYYKKYERKDHVNEQDSPAKENFETKLDQEFGYRKYKGPSYKRRNYNGNRFSNRYYDRGE